MTTAQSGRASIRVLVVDDSPFMRKVIKRTLDAQDDITVVETVSTGEATLEAVKRLDPDVVTLDIVLPGIDGIEVLDTIMAQHPVPVLMLSLLTTDDADVTLTALDKGAVDVVAKPAVNTHMDMPRIAGTLVEKVRAAAGVHIDRLDRGAQPKLDAGSGTPQVSLAKSEMDAVIIGASTGGPPALGMIASAIPVDFPVPVLLVQHMPPGFTAALAERLDKICRLPVREASDGDVFAPGHVFVARSGMQHHFVPRGSRVTLQLDKNPPGLQHVPSIDVVMRSAAVTFANRGIGVLLTGMGEDGARGLLAMRQAGAHTIAEAEESAVIWGMPRAAAVMDSARAVIPLNEIPSSIMQVAEGTHETR